MADHLAFRRNPPGQSEHEAAHGIDIRVALVLAQDRPHAFLELLHRQTGIQVQRAIGALGQMGKNDEVAAWLDAATTADTNVENTEVTNLTSAQNNIQNADIASTTSNLAQDNILEQTGFAAIQQSTSAEQNVLKLLQ